MLLGVNMQTSFMHPPFGFALFYLRSVAPSRETIDRVTGRLIAPVTTAQIYWGAIPFVVIQLVMVGVLIGFPDLVLASLDHGPKIDPSKIQIEVPQPCRANCRNSSSSDMSAAEKCRGLPRSSSIRWRTPSRRCKRRRKREQPVLLLSAVDAGLSAGAGWWREVIAAARDSVPAAQARARCSIAATMPAPRRRALREGVEAIVFSGRAEVRERLADIARRRGSRVHAQRVRQPRSILATIFSRRPRHCTAAFSRFCGATSAENRAK